MVDGQMMVVDAGLMLMVNGWLMITDERMAGGWFVTKLLCFEL